MTMEPAARQKPHGGQGAGIETQDRCPILSQMVQGWHSSWAGGPRPQPHHVPLGSGERCVYSFSW